MGYQRASHPRRDAIGRLDNKRASNSQAPKVRSCTSNCLLPVLPNSRSSGMIREHSRANHPRHNHAESLRSSKDLGRLRLTGGSSRSITVSMQKPRENGTFFRRCQSVAKIARLLLTYSRLRSTQWMLATGETQPTRYRPTQPTSSQHHTHSDGASRPHSVRPIDVDTTAPRIRPTGQRSATRARRIYTTHTTAVDHPRGSRAPTARTVDRASTHLGRRATSCAHRSASAHHASRSGSLHRHASEVAS